MKQDAPPTRPVATRVSEKLYAFLEAEQARLYQERGIKMPLSAVVRMMLELAHRAATDASEQTPPRRKVASPR